MGEGVKKVTADEFRRLKEERYRKEQTELLRSISDGLKTLSNSNDQSVVKLIQKLEESIGKFVQEVKRVEPKELPTPVIQPQVSVDLLPVKRAIDELKVFLESISRPREWEFFIKRGPTGYIESITATSKT